VETFVVRIWIQPEPRAPDESLRGFVERSGSDRRIRFASGGELLAFLENTTGIAPARRVARNGPCGDDPTVALTASFLSPLPEGS
jgi:hypothetical protein